MAHGVRRGLKRERDPAPEGRKIPGEVGSVAPLGLGPITHAHPRLTPWAIVFRPSGPETAGHQVRSTDGRWSTESAMGSMRRSKRAPDGSTDSAARFAPSPRMRPTRTDAPLVCHDPSQPGGVRATASLTTLFITLFMQRLLHRLSIQKATPRIHGRNTPDRTHLLRHPIQPQRRCLPDNFAQWNILLGCRLSKPPHHWVRKQDLHLLHGSMLCMEPCGSIDPHPDPDRSLQAFPPESVKSMDLEKAVGTTDGTDGTDKRGFAWDRLTPPR